MWAKGRIAQAVRKIYEAYKGSKGTQNLYSVPNWVESRTKMHFPQVWKHPKHQFNTQIWIEDQDALPPGLEIPKHQFNTQIWIGLEHTKPSAANPYPQAEAGWP